MITAVRKGSRTRGLVEYLFGPGRAEEHTRQRIVGGWDSAWVGIEHPDEVQRALLTAELDGPLRTAALVGERAPARHVYHVSISNHAEDRNLTDAESEFVELVRTGGMLVRPRWAKGGQERVVGYMVAVRPPKDEPQELVWFGGGKLDRDLTLPALRAGWEDDPTAVAAWREIGSRAAKRLPPSEPGVIGEATAQLAQIGDALAAVPVTDGQAWSAVARDAAGVVSALSIRVQGPQKVALTQAAHALSRAVARQNRPVARPAHAVSFTDAARATMTVVTGGRSGPAGTVLLLHQLIRLAQTIAAANEAAGRAAQAGAAVEAATVARAAVREMDKPRYGPNGYTGMSGPASSVGREDPREIGRRRRRGQDEQRRRNTTTDRGIER